MILVFTFGCHGFQAWGTFPLPLAMSLRIQMPSFPQGAYNLTAFKQKQNKTKRIEITSPRVSNDDSMAEPQIEPRAFGSSLRLCPEVYFFPQETISPLGFTTGRGIIRVSDFYFGHSSRHVLIVCSVQASLDYESAENTENTVSALIPLLPVHTGCLECVTLC